MTKLAELASLIRSKNAGPFQLTLDIMFDSKENYEKVKESEQLSTKTVAQIYGLSEGDVLFFFCDNALAIKASFARPNFQGDIEDADGHGGQQYAPLMDIEI